MGGRTDDTAECFFENFHKIENQQRDGGGEAGQVMMDRAAEAETRKVESPRRR